MPKINNEPVEYKELSKIIRLSIFLLSVGPEIASGVLARFEDAQIELICKEISKLKLVDEDLKNEALEEFSNIIGQSFGALSGGMTYAKKALELACGGDQAKTFLGRIEPEGSTADLIQTIKEINSREVYNLLKNEQPQTIAFVLANVSINKSVEVLNYISEEKRNEILEHLGTTKEVSLEVLAKIAKNLKSQLKQEEPVVKEQVEGIVLVAEILNQMSKEFSKSFLAHLDETNPDLSGQISKKMFSFEDLIKLSVTDLQRISREIETNDLVLALKACSKELAEALFSSVSKRAAESLKEELEMLGPVKVKTVEEAQARIIQVVKRLEEEGVIEISEGGGDVIN